MARWTLSYEHLDRTVRTSYWVQIGNDLWGICDRIVAPSSKMLVFKTEFREYTVIDCPIPLNVLHFVEKCFSHSDQIYIWAVHDPRVRNSTKLYRLDPQTLQWDYLLTTSTSRNKSCEIRENIMYTLCVVDGTHRLETIDLERKIVISNQVLEEQQRNVYLELISHKGKLYLFRHSYEDHSRSVEVFENGVRRCLHRDHYQIVEHANRRGVWSELHNGLFCQLAMANNSLIGFDEFDFNSNEWNKIRVDKSWFDESWVNRPYDFFKIKGTIYTVLDREIRLLEITPSLLTICLHTIIDDFFTKDLMEELEAFCQLIPAGVKDDWENMIVWRLKELEHKTDHESMERFRVAAAVVLERMRHVQLINRREFDALSYAFKDRRV